MFRIYFPEFGMNFRVVRRRAYIPVGTQLLMDVMSFEKRPDSRNPRPWATGGLAAGTAELAIRGAVHHRRASAPDRPAVKLKAPPSRHAAHCERDQFCRVTEPVLEDSKSR